MTPEQLRAFRHATASEGLALIEGPAGTGKSYTIAAIRQAYEIAGYRVVGLAPTNAVAQDMQADGARGARASAPLRQTSRARSAAMIRAPLFAEP